MISTLYADLPAYVRRTDEWDAAPGSKVKIVIPRPTWDSLLRDANILGSHDETGFVLAGFQPENQFRAIVTDYERIAQGNRTTIGTTGKQYVDAFLRMRARMTNVEQFLELPIDQKIIVGGAHTHPNHGVFLSARDQESLREFRRYAQMHPEIYAMSDGNFEIVIDPVKNKFDGFKFGPSGYEAVNIHVKNLEDCLRELMS